MRLLLNKRRASGMFVLFFTIMVLLTAVMPGWTDGAKADTAVAKNGPAVAVIPVKEDVESVLYSFLERAYKEAGDAGVEHIVLIVNTLGGEVKYADKMGELIRNHKIKTTAFIEGRAMSAGTYIALNANQIVMQNASIMGAAAVVDGSGQLSSDPKVNSFWISSMDTAAKLNGRDGQIAIAMVDPNSDLDLTEQIGRHKKPGEVLSISAEEALKLGYAEHIAPDVASVIKWLGLEHREVIEINPTFSENAARWIIDPYIKTILLIIGIAGILIELIVPGFGAPGIIGGLAFALYFFGHYIAGVAGVESVVLFVIGLALIIIELFVPSFGVLGIIGGVSLIAGVVFASDNPTGAFISLLIALVIAVIITVLVARTNKGRAVWNKFILKEKLSAEEGYLPAEEKNFMIGMEGIALTTLRPAGTALFGDDRVDVVTSGEFIENGAKLIITKAEGTWIFVKEIKSDHK